MKNILLCCSVCTLLLLASCNVKNRREWYPEDGAPMSGKVMYVNANPIITSGATTNLDFMIDFKMMTPAIGNVVKAGVAYNDSVNIMRRGYVNTEFGDVSCNVLNAGTPSIRQVLRLGNQGSANFTSGSTSPIAVPIGILPDYYHTIISSSSRISKSRDTVIMTYDELVPSPNFAKVRVMNLVGNEKRIAFMDTLLVDTIFNDIQYGTFSNSIVPRTTSAGSYAGATNGLNTPGLSWKTLGPFKEVNPGNYFMKAVAKSTLSPVPINGSSTRTYTFEAGKMYSVILSGNSLTDVRSLVITHPLPAK